jgi:hypothetical protein
MAVPAINVVWTVSIFVPFSEYSVQNMQQEQHLKNQLEPTEDFNFMKCNKEYEQDRHNLEHKVVILYFL